MDWKRIWPFETRAQAIERAVSEEVNKREQSYTQKMVEQQVQNAEEGLVSDAISTLEIAAGFWSRAFAAAVIEPIDHPLCRALTPQIMSIIGRTLIREGELCLLMEVMNGNALITPASGWDVFGGYDRRDWRYRLTLQGPDKDRTRKTTIDGDLVIHAMYGVDNKNPFRGCSPLSYVNLTDQLRRNIEQRLKEEYSGPVGAVIPVPDAVENVQALATDIRNLKGRIALVETTTGGWGDGPREGSQRDFVAERIGADPPTGTVQLRQDVSDSILAACGIPPSLGSTGSVGADTRESWRQFLHGTIAPVANTLQTELREKFQLNDVEINFENLFASDIQGRARAFRSLTQGGLSPADASEICGWGRRGSEEPLENLSNNAGPNTE